MRTRHPGRPGADDRDFATAADALTARVAQFGIDAAQIEVVRLNAEFFADESLQRADGNRSVERSAPAFGFAGRGANTAADGGKRVRRPRDDVGIFITSLGNRLHIAAGVCAHGTAFAAEDLPGEITYVRKLNWIRRRHFAERRIDGAEVTYRICCGLPGSSLLPRPFRRGPLPVSHPPLLSCGRSSHTRGNRKSSCRRDRKSTRLNS